MVIAALACFALLLIAWIVAPDGPRSTALEEPMPEAQPIAA